jgi:hypothetical protein
LFSREKPFLFSHFEFVKSAVTKKCYLSYFLQEILSLN